MLRRACGIGHKSSSKGESLVQNLVKNGQSLAGTGKLDPVTQAQRNDVPSLFSQLTGTWGLISYTNQNESGEIEFPLGRDATGFLIYTGDGYMSAQLMMQKRPDYASGDVHNGTQAEMAAAANGYLAYSGPFYVDEATRAVTHMMTISLRPNWIGQIQSRVLKLNQDHLIMTMDPRLAFGSLGSPRLEWRRVQPNIGG